MHRILLCLLLLPSLAGAVDFQTTRFDDPLPNGCAVGDCSLREAVNDAQAQDGADRVLLQAGTYTIDYDDTLDIDSGETGPLVIRTPLEIVGAGREATTLLATAANPFVIGVSLNAPPAALTLSDFTIATFNPTANVLAPVFVAENGTLTVRRFGVRGNTAPVGAILAAGPLTVIDSVFEDNVADSSSSGGIIVVQESTLSVTGSQFVDNTSTLGALVISTGMSSDIDLRDNRFAGNLSTQYGGALSVFQDAGFLRIDLSDSVFEINHAVEDGGAVWMKIGASAATSTRLAVTADGARFTGNRSDAACGAMSIEVDPELELVTRPTLTMDLARFDDNIAGSSGGALCTAADTTITHTTFEANTAATLGGAIVQGVGTLRIERSTLSGNQAGTVGGAVISLGEIVLENSTVHGNTAGNTAGGLLLSGPGESRILRSTLAGNTADGAPNALRFVSIPQLPGTLLLRSSILQGGCTTNAPGMILPNGYNIESPGNTCSLSGGASQNQRNVSAANLALGPLADNGGPTLTRMPGDASVARDPGLSDGSPCSRIDQRGYASVDTHCDVGAVEVAGIPPEPPSPAVFADGFE